MPVFLRIIDKRKAFSCNDMSMIRGFEGLRLAFCPPGDFNGREWQIILDYIIHQSVVLFNNYRLNLIRESQMYNRKGKTRPLDSFVMWS